MRENFELTLFETADELVEVAANEAISKIKVKLAKDGTFHIALTGGVLGNHFAHKFVEIVNGAGNVAGLHIWFSDERFDTSDSPLRNSRPVRDGLRNHSVTVHEVNPSDAGAHVSDAAAAYSGELRGVTMDICVLGLGPDGHVGSLFPVIWNQNAAESAIAVVDSPKPPAERVSFSMAFINASEQVWIMASGEVRARAVQWVLAAEPSVPAGHVRAAGTTRLFVDAEAFSKS